MKRFFETHSAPLQGALCVLALLVAPACSSGSGEGDAGDGGNQDPVDPALLNQARGVITTQGISPVAAPPTRPQALIDLGQALFFDKELSGNRDVSCATCHLPSAAGADGRTLPGGVGGSGVATSRLGGSIVPRNSPSTLNTHLNVTMFWDSRVEILPGDVLRTPAGADLTAAMEAVFLPGLEVLAAQAMFPPTSRDEMRGQPGDNELADEADSDFTAIWDGIVTRLMTFPAYQSMFQAAYPGTLLADFNMAHVGNAIAAFEASAFSRIDSPFQAWLQGDDQALSEDALRGLLDFYSPNSRCSVCHRGDTFTDSLHHNIGMPQFGPGKGDGLGGDDDAGRERVTGNNVDRYRFRTPTLLNVGLTAPYGHTGQFSTLRSMLQHYRNVDDSLNNYQIADHVDDPTLIATQVANQTNVLATVHGTLQNPTQFNVDNMVEFMNALTAASAGDLSDIIPASVPSGLPLDM